MTLPSWKRSLGWALVGAGLVALGVGVHHFTSPEPVGTTPLSIAMARPIGFLPSGPLMLTLSQKSRYGHEYRAHIEKGVKANEARLVSRSLGPVQVWDLTSGTPVREFLDGQTFYAQAWSWDCRYFAAELCQVEPKADGEPPGNRRLVLVDLVTGSQCDVPLPEVGVMSMLYFSPDGKRLARIAERLETETEPPPRTLMVFDVATGKILAERPTRDLGHLRCFTADRLLHEVPGNLLTIEVLDLQTGQTAGTIKNVSTRTQVTPDGRYLIEYDSPKKDRHEVIFRDLGTLQVAGRTEAYGAVVMSPDGRYFLRSSDPLLRDLEMCEFPSGKVVGGTGNSSPGRGVRIPSWFSPDGRFLAVCGKEPMASVILYELPSMKQLWVRESGHSIMPGSFSADSRKLFLVETNPHAVHVMDCATGQVLTPVNHAQTPQILWHALPPFPSLTRVESGAMLVQMVLGAAEDGPIMTRVRQWLPWLKPPEASHDLTVVLDGVTGQERFRLAGWSTSSALLSPDGRWLATDHGNVMRLWDVDARKPLRGAIGIPVVAGGIIALAVRWRRRRQGLKESSRQDAKAPREPGQG